MKARLSLCLIPLFLGFTWLYADEPTPDYLNPDLPIEQRVDDLVSRMTLEEKASQMLDQAKAIPRLGIPAYGWWNEGLHGVARAGIATVFPQAIGLAATWDDVLMNEVADVISTEARAKHHEFLRNDSHARFQGLTYWSPNINIFRDPRWGRGQETYGEDPYLTSRMGVAFVKGLQGSDSRYLKLVATPKHYAVHSGPEPERHRFDAVANKRDYFETYLPAFKACVQEADAYSVMCAYNRYQGEACCGSSAMLKELLREAWGFQGYIVSDCGAVEDIYKHHKIVKTAPEAAALAVQSGTDLNCGIVYDPALVEAVKLGYITEKEVDVSVKRLFTARFKLGMFDPPERVPYAQIPLSENDSEAHRQLSVKAAQESIVLLKNENGVLPLDKNCKQVAVIGPTADSFPMLLGNYNGVPSDYTTPFQGIREKLGEDVRVVYEQGCNLVKEGPIAKILTGEVVRYNGKAGLYMEYFNNPRLEGEPFHTCHNVMNGENQLWGDRVPELDWRSSFSIRWSGTFVAPETGDFNFEVKGDDGYRLTLGDQVVVEDWADHDHPMTSSNTIALEKDKSYPISLEFYKSTGWPFISVEWEILSKDPFHKALNLAKDSDVVIFVGGITAQLEGEEMHVGYEGFEGGDRTSLKMPKVQEDLLKTLQATGKPVILVLTSGSALAVNWANDHIPAIVQIWYPGQEGGTALADVLFGDYNPAGRLPITYYQSIDQLPPFEDYNMKGKTYRFFEEMPLYPFGYGLSYTSFSYSDLTLPESVCTGEPVSVSVAVQNTGDVAGDEVVQLYVKDVDASVPVPKHALKGFKRIYLTPGERKTVTFTLEPDQLVCYQDDGTAMEEPGEFKIYAGGVQPGFEASTTQVLDKMLVVTGDPLTYD